jgi:hypothetical protein
MLMSAAAFRRSREQGSESPLRFRFFFIHNLPILPNYGVNDKQLHSFIYSLFSTARAGL